MWCPSIGEKPSSAQLKLSAICSNSTCIMDRLSGLKCHHPFKKQVVRASFFPASPYVISTVVFNKPLSGLYVQLTKVLAEKLDFDVKISITQTGQFFPKNKTFGPGIFQSVNRFIPVHETLLYVIFSR